MLCATAPHTTFQLAHALSGSQGGRKHETLLMMMMVCRHYGYIETNAVPAHKHTNHTKIERLSRHLSRGACYTLSDVFHKEGCFHAPQSTIARARGGVGGVLLHSLVSCISLVVWPWTLASRQYRETEQDVGFHLPGRRCLHQARGTVRCSASRMEGDLHPTKNRVWDVQSCIRVTGGTKY